ncbi:hypothetical protein [Hyphomicrobium denitrificans]|uniref:hypothetical protein n=1 Tax=Hyphomicrobium denitrificans TaxID=53399 RepID=UPI00022E6D9F|nr:hypothetical protein [Hyphomicrobium denitrificans]
MLRKQGIAALIGSACALTIGASLTFAADAPSSSTTSNAKVNTEPGSKGKTSDRTPGDPAPKRTPNASSTGNTGTDAGQTNEGTSDRTPKK